MRTAPKNKMATPLNKDRSEILDRTEKYIDDILTQARAEKDAMNRQLTELEDKEAQALKDMETAAESADANFYLKASTAHAKAQAEQNTIKEFMRQEQEKPLITRDEYDKYVAAVKTAAYNKGDEIRARMADIVDDLAEQAQEMENLQARANALLHGLQYDLYRNHDDEFVRDNVGRIMYSRKFVFDEEHPTGDFIPAGPMINRPEVYVDMSQCIAWARRPRLSPLYTETKR